MGRIKHRKLINKYGKYPNDLYGILESLKGNDKSLYMPEDAFREIEKLINQQVLKALEEVKSNAIGVNFESNLKGGDFRIAATPVSVIQEIEKDYK